MACTIIDTDRIWVGGIIPAVIDETDYPAGTEGWKNVLNALMKWNSCQGYVIIRPKADSDPDWVRIKHGDRCQSVLGRSRFGGEQIVTCSTYYSTGLLMHEFGHAAGLHHEHQRPDRGIWKESIGIRINEGNVDPAWKPHIVDTATNCIVIGTYDWRSIMHYGARSGALRDSSGQPLVTIQPVIGHGEDDAEDIPVSIGQTEGLSAMDIEGLRYLYSYSYPDWQRRLLKIQNRLSDRCIFGQDPYHLWETPIHAHILGTGHPDRMYFPRGLFPRGWGSEETRSSGLGRHERLGTQDKRLPDQPVSWEEVLRKEAGHKT